MASILIRQLGDSTKARLKLRAAQRGHSMEEEARTILKSALSTEEPTGQNLGSQIHRRFAALGGVDLPEIAREPVPRPPEFR